MALNNKNLSCKSFVGPIMTLTIVFSGIIALDSCNVSNNYKYSFMDPALETEARVDDLLSRMTLEEKVGQMMNEALEIKRLGYT